MSLVTFLLLIFSLWRHLRKMQHSVQGCRDVSTTAHIRALQTVIASLIFLSPPHPLIPSPRRVTSPKRLEDRVTGAVVGCQQAQLLSTNESDIDRNCCVRCHAIIIVELIIGSAANGFIALVNIIDWFRRRKISSVDQILTALAISRINMLWSVFTIVLISSPNLDLEMTVKIVRIKNNTWILANHFSLWLATCLGIFYFLKIANFSNYIFLYLKWRIKKVVSMTLLLSLIFLFANILVMNIHIDVWSGEFKRNLSYSSTLKNCKQFHRLIFLINTMFTLIPFTVSLIIFILLIFSLWTHLRNIWFNVKGIREPSTIAHINALLVMVAFLFFYTVFFLTLATQVLVSPFIEKQDFSFATVMIIFPSVHSCVLIVRNSKLRHRNHESLIFKNEKKRQVTVLEACKNVGNKINGFIALENSMMAEITLGSFANVFIVLVIFTDYVKTQKISLADRILTALAIFRIGLLWVILINWCSTVFNTSLLTIQVKSMICVIWVITNHFNIWLAAILSILYLLKIGNFSNPIFLGLKRKIKSIIIVVLLESLMCLFPNLIMLSIFGKIQVNVHQGNWTRKTKVVDAISLTVMTAFTLSNIIPFTTCMICFLLLIYSLCKHLKSMKLYRNESQDRSTMAHIKALQAVISFLLLFSMFILSLLISGYSYMKSLDEPVHLICQIIGTLYPSSHSYILIWGNKKIKQAFVKMDTLAATFGHGNGMNHSSNPVQPLRLTMDPYGFGLMVSFSWLKVVAEIILGNFSNGLIMLKNSIDWVNKKKLSPADQILIILAISRMTLIWEILFFWVKIKSISFITREELKILVLCCILSSHFCLWLATALSIFYFLRIANFSWPIFLYLKWRFKQLIVGLLLGSLTFLIANLIQTSIILEERFYQYGENTTVNLKETEFILFSEIILFNMTMFSVTPFLLALSSFLLLIYSLWKHLQKMQHNSRGHRDPSTKAHTNAVKIMVSFLLFYATYVLSLLISCIAEKRHKELVRIICMIIGLMYPSVHSLFLILGNSKLKQTLLLLVRHLGCRHRLQPSPKLFVMSPLICKISKTIVRNVKKLNCLCSSIFSMEIKNALQTVVAFLLFYITFILSLVVEFWTGVIEKGLIPLFVRVIITIFPSIHPWFFIWGHRKLRQDLLLVLQWLRYWLALATICQRRQTFWEMFMMSNIILGKSMNLIICCIRNKYPFGIFIFIFIPFTVSLTAFLLLIFSLWRHLKNMHHNAKGSRDISTTAHLKALQMVIVFLMLYTCFFLSIIAIIWISELDNKVVFLFCIAIGAIYPTGHSFILIWGNQKLKQALLLFLKQAPYYKEYTRKFSKLWSMGRRSQGPNIAQFSIHSWQIQFPHHNIKIESGVPLEGVGSKVPLQCV
ncbi:taste receptor type 2 member 124-like [Sigmodon hispidus]